MAQLAARLIPDQKVERSSRSTPTSFFFLFLSDFFFLSFFRLPLNFYFKSDRQNHPEQEDYMKGKPSFGHKTTDRLRLQPEEMGVTWNYFSFQVPISKLGTNQN